MSPTPENRELARYIRFAFGARSPRVFRCWDEANRTSVDVVMASGSPTAGVNSYSTIGLSDFSIDLTANSLPLRVEFVIAIESSFADATNLLATCAFNVANSKFAIKPGVVYRSVVEMYRPASTLKHVLFVEPNVWPLKTQSLPTKTVAWLQALPISEAEAAFHYDKGGDALEAMFETINIDLFDIDRPSVL